VPFLSLFIFVSENNAITWQQKQHLGMQQNWGGEM
jgi:hypothetical protein